MAQDFSSLTAISPIDGRYYSKTKKLSDYFSEFALIKYRLIVEINYLIFLKKLPLPQLEQCDLKILEKIASEINELKIEEAQEIKDIEKVTNHDVKAVEYFLKNKMIDHGLNDHVEFVHFGLTSQDINNTAIPLSLKLGLEEVVLPELNTVLEQLLSMSQLWKQVPMLARTHGQPASPTTLGKEIYVFYSRVQDQLSLQANIPHRAKFGGATGNFNAHVLAYPEINWAEEIDSFIAEYFDLERTAFTTQIEPYDMLAALLHSWIRINNIFIDFARDCWTYISMEYFGQKTIVGEIGSSAMPHKVNPIDFENAEGNLALANANFSFLADKLTKSRLQRDLTDSTVLRNIGVPFGHVLVALKSLQKGISKLELNQDKLEIDLENNWAVLAEAIQTILRRENIDKPYEKLKDLTRGKKKINQAILIHFIDNLEVNDEIKEELRNLKPIDYIGHKFDI